MESAIDVGVHTDGDVDVAIDTASCFGLCSWGSPLILSNPRPELQA